jgi:type V secretory pathway adhesin AidA
MRNQLIQSLLITGVLALTACGGTETATAPDTTAAPVAASPAETEIAAADSTTDHSAATKGGQVVETGAYHLELVPVPEADGIHLDLYLQTGDTHEAVADATVVAQVQLPDGTQQALPMEYDAAGEHFFAFLPSQSAGEYRTVIQTDINGEKVNARFSFAK